MHVLPPIYSPHKAGRRVIIAMPERMLFLKRKHSELCSHKVDPATAFVMSASVPETDVYNISVHSSV